MIPGFWQNAGTTADDMKKAGNGKTAARAPRNGRHGGKAAARILVGLWMDGVSGRETMDGIHAELSSRALDWNVRFSDSPAAFETTALWMLGAGLLDGVITRYHGSGAMERIRAAGIPAVILFPDSRPEGAAKRPPPRTAFVEMDVAAVAREAVAHFSARAGFRSAGFVESCWDSGWSRHRGDAVGAEFRRAGIPFSRFLHYGAASPPVGAAGPDFAGLEAYLRALEKPAAVVAANDATGVDVVQVCAAAGIAVPREIAVLGMDDNPVHCLHCAPNLSSVHFDGLRAGRLCAAALAGLMRPRGAAPRAPLRYGASGVVRRASTGAVSTAGALVQKALDFIDANACRGISLADVARHLGVSRSLATQRFRELRGASILDAIHARRIAEAKRLLASSGKPLDDIAAACGFRGGADCLRRVFRASTGLTPAQWRERKRKR